MFDIAWYEIMVIGVVALLVIGPKELPELLHTLGVWVGRMRTYAQEFRSHFDDLVREAELKKMREQWNSQVLANEAQEIQRSLSLDAGYVANTVAEAQAPAPAPAQEGPAPALAEAPTAAPAPQERS